MTLGELLARLDAMMPVGGLVTAEAASLARRVQAVAYDSRAVVPGAIFVALKGQQADGTAFAVQAVERGAIAVLAATPAAAADGVPWFVVSDPRRALAACAAIFERFPSDDLLVVGVTGTNGKTTTTYLLASIFEAAGHRCGRVGTTGYRLGTIEHEAARTTPEAPDLQRLLRQMVEQRCSVCVMEVSSHALALHRVDHTRFAAAVFTNLTRDHLDFHDGMEDYFLAKRRLFEMLAPAAPMAVNADDPYGQRLKAEFPGAVTFGFDPRADVSVEGLSLTIDGTTGQVTTPRGRFPLQSRLVGRPNVSNVLAATAVASAMDVPLDAIASGISAVSAVPGRFQAVSSDRDEVAVVVDYAHTDDALRSLLETARALTRGRIITVFGCGGDRDRTKRPLMGAVAARSSDLVVLTSDNPRSEDPLEIIEDIKRGLVSPERPLVHQGQPVPPVRTAAWIALPDRRQAIAHAIAEARPGDLVLIAGKGHERTQTIGDRVLPFDDVEVAREALEARRQAASAPGGGA